MINRQKIIVVVLLSMIIQSCYSMNLLRPYDSLIRPMYNNDYRWQVSVWADTGVSDKAFNGDGCRVNALRIWNEDQNALAMLDGFPVDSDVSKKRIELDADDDGVRGHFLVCGDVKNRFSGMIAARGFFRDTWSISAYLPIYSMELTNVCWVDQTKNVSDEDVRVHELLTDNFFENVKKLGCDLDLCRWKRTGLGDLTLLLEWFRDFPQQKPMLKNVRINWRGGLSLPTGLRQDVDKVFAFPFGNDGAFALPFGFGLDLDFAFYVRAGFDIQLTHIFGNTRSRRIKTSDNQTDLLLLEKMAVYKDFGLTQQFNLYAQLYKIFKGFSVLFGYQFIKHGKDTLALCPGADFSSVVANSANYLNDWTIHQIVVRADYEIGSHFDDPPVYPRISFFAQLPFNGKRVAVTSNIGITFALDF